MTQMKSINIISMGPGSEEFIAPAAMKLMGQSEKVFCAERYMSLVPEGKERPISPLGAALEEIALERENGNEISVLVSGDAGLYSMLETLSRRFGRESLNVVPGISSLSAFCARLGVSWQGACILSAHGRKLSPSELCQRVRMNEKVLLLLDAVHTPRWIKQALTDGGIGNTTLYIGEKVSYPDEYVGEYVERDYDPLSVALIENPSPEKGLPHVGIDDGEFIRGKTPMTKRVIRELIINRLRLTPDAVVWDIGAGTGSVSIECARQCPLGSVYAIEREEDTLELIKQNTARFRALNLIPVYGSAPEALEDLPVPTHVFLGGSGGKTAEILRLLRDLHANIRLCATAVTVETEYELMQEMSALDGFEAVQVASSSIDKIGSYQLRRANNPVTVFAANIGG